MAFSGRNDTKVVIRNYELKKKIHCDSIVT